MEPFGLTATAVGPIMFLAGFIAGNYRATHTLLIERSIAAAAIAVIVVAVGSNIAAVAMMAIIASTLVLANITEWWHRRRLHFQRRALDNHDLNPGCLSRLLRYTAAPLHNR